MPTIKKQEQIRRSVSTDYLKLPKEERKSRSLIADFSVAFQEGNEELRKEETKNLENLGIKFFGIDVIFASLLVVMKEYGLSIPYPDYADGNSLSVLGKKERKTIIKEQKEMTNKIFSLFSINFVEKELIITLGENEEEKNITQEVMEMALGNDHKVKNLYRYQGLMNRSLGMLRSMSDKLDSFAMEISSPSQAIVDGPVIGVNGREEVPFTWRKDADLITSGDSGVVHTAILRELTRYQVMVERRKGLERYVSNGEVSLEPEFKVDHWPTHPLMTHIKNEAIPFITDETKNSGILCDEQDIRYQTLFRLTTYSFDELFHNGDELVSYLEASGAYDHWRNILTLDSDVLSKFKINEGLIRTIVREQLIIIEDRLANSPLPVKEILTRSGIFEEDGWKMEKSEGNIYAVRYDDSNEEIGRKKVSFKEVDSDLATSFHHAFHYIHTPRTGRAYGLFLEGEEIPFSVLAIEPIDRDYKKNMLLMQGYDPKHCIDLARLYSRPGTPFNTSSTIFSLVFSDIRTNHPEIQAVLSAFMPTYATGKSMLSGGFDNPVLIKPNRHTFGKRNVGGSDVYEHMTKRRMSEAKEFVSIHKDMPMLPVVELMTRLKAPRFSPLDIVDGQMVVCEN